MAKPIIKTNLKGSDKIELKYNGREVDMTLTDFKTYLDEVLEPTNAVLTSTEPLRYKALISMSYESYTSGVLTIGKTYIISILEVGDDFSNVGFVSEKTPFVATNTTPTNWGNGTEVINGDSSTYAIEGIHVDTLLPTVYNGFIGDTYCCIIEKTGVFVYNTTYTSVFTRQDDDILYFELNDEGLKQVEIEVYP